MRGLGGLLASRFGRLAGTGFGFGSGQTWQQIVDENEVGWFCIKEQKMSARNSSTRNITV